MGQRESAVWFVLAMAFGSVSRATTRRLDLWQLKHEEMPYSLSTPERVRKYPSEISATAH